MIKMISLAWFFLVFTITSLVANPSLGEDLEKQMWEDMKNRNWENVEKHIAHEFQSVHTDGMRNRGQELSLIKRLGIDSYSISHLTTTERGDVIVVTYLAAASETIDGERLASRPTPRMSVWQKNNGTWQWIAHANLIPFKDAY